MTDHEEDIIDVTPTDLGPDTDNLPVEAPPPATSLVAMERLSPEKQEKARALMAKIDLEDTQSILAFGVEAQKEVTESADRMLGHTRNKDVGPVGNDLNGLMVQVRGLGVNELDPGNKGNWLQRNILRSATPLAKFVQRYETVQGQIDTIARELDAHRTALIRDVTMLDRLYDATLAYFGQLELYIAAADAKLVELDTDVLPALEATARESGDMLDAQRLRDMQARRMDLERRSHDLKLTRTVTLQSLPQIRLIQDVDKSLVNKIQSSILTTIPVWKSQIAMAITLWNQQQALQTQKAVTDTTNEMLARNAELLRMGSAEARQEIERGIFDVETIRKVNEELMQTIRESIEITEEGKRRRIESERELVRLEGELKQALLQSGSVQTRLLETDQEAPAPTSLLDE
jgi:uncharacterized protein YaaN involved in tellurite resistance